MRTYDEIMAGGGRPGPAFSNGTEGYGWMDWWCARCRNDAEQNCPIVTALVVGNAVTKPFIPPELLDGPRDEQGRYGIETKYTCVEFRPYPEPGDDSDPPPVPVHPDQLALLPAEPYVGVRMFADVVKGAERERVNA